MDQERAGVQAVQPEGAGEGPGRVQARLPGVEPATHEWLDGQMKVPGERVSVLTGHTARCLKASTADSTSR